MRTLRLEQLNRDVSRLCLGTMVFTRAPRELTFDMLDLFVASGGNLLDTAEVYGSEPAIADWLEARDNRESIVILDKACHELEDITVEGIRRGIATNLERIRSDYIDIWMLHRDDPTKPVEVVVETANEEIDAGRIRAYGGSNWSTQRLQETNEYAEARGLVGMIGSSEHLSLATPNEERWSGVRWIAADDLEWRESSGFPLFPWSSQAGGFFTGRFRPDDHSDAEMVRIYYSDDNFARLARAEELAGERGASSIQIALAYVLAQSFPTFPLIGPASMPELEVCIEAEKIDLSEAETQWLAMRTDTRS
ncbi:aldo/keto reductase [Candidatus Poribacteria bacterium]|nr:aldo/keto reductase [Candidatus Poribacteria bacterium]